MSLVVYDIGQFCVDLRIIIPKVQILIGVLVYRFVVGLFWLDGTVRVFRQPDLMRQRVSRRSMSAEVRE